MSTKFGPEPNPYQAPATTGGAPPAHASPGGIDRKFIKKFRQEIHAVGGFWIIIGALALGLAIAALASSDGPQFLFSPENAGLLAFICGLGTVWIVLGALACAKHMWAVKTALVLSYISLAGQVLSLSICAALLLIVVIVQAHRVIGWARQIRAAGLPLTIRPEQVGTEQAGAHQAFAPSLQPPAPR
jgi:hypothetical protein